jgi:uncharacterized protein DUF222
LITDEAAMAAVDAALAARITRWGAWSAKKTETAIDALVDAHDPAALRRCREAAATPSVQFGSPADAAATTTIYARLNAPDAALIEQTVEQSARGVCDGDPRTSDQRRVAAFTAAFTHTPLACGCGQPDCPGSSADTPATNAVVYVIAEKKSVDAAKALGSERTADNLDASEPPGDAASSTAVPGEAAGCTSAPPAFVFGAAILPTPLLGAILDRARIRDVGHPGDAPPEPRYTPSRALCEFVRCRDLTCRFPGCDKPAQFCDLDHTVAYRVGPTHPSNLKCLCRFQLDQRFSTPSRSARRPTRTVATLGCLVAQQDTGRA